MAKRASQIAYVSIGVGGLLLWSAIINRSVLGVLQDVVSGKQPKSGPKGPPLFAEVIPGHGSPDPSINTGSRSGDIRGAAQGILNDNGMGNQFPAADKLVFGESNWNPLAENPDSNAFGVAQALGHGTLGTASTTVRYQKGRRKGQFVNMYGGFGLNATEAKAANSGDGVEQFIWMMHYVKAQYGSFDNAYAKWLSRNPHWY